MDSEGQDQNSSPVFESKDIGSQPTVEFFPGAEKQKLKKKRQEKSSRHNRKKLAIIFFVIAIIAVFVMVIAIVTNLPKSDKHVWTHADFPENIDDLKEKAFSIVFEGEGTYADAAEYVYFAVDDTEDEDRQFTLQAFHAEVMSYGGYFNSAKTELERLEALAATDARKYTLYNTMVGVYFRSGDTALANEYYDKLNALDVPENQVDYQGSDDGSDAESVEQTVHETEETIRQAEEKAKEAEEGTANE